MENNPESHQIPFENLEMITRLEKEIEFYKKEALTALEKNDFGDLSGTATRLMGLKNQIEHWKNFGVSKQDDNEKI